MAVLGAGKAIKGAEPGKRTVSGHEMAILFSPVSIMNPLYLQELGKARQPPGAAHPTTILEKEIAMELQYIAPLIRKSTQMIPPR